MYAAGFKLKLINNLSLVCDISLTTTYSLWFIPLCLLLGFTLSFFAYFRNNKFSDVSKWKVGTMMTLRGLTLSIIAFLLLEPVISTAFRSVEQPLIIIAQDRSASLLYNNDSLALQQQDEKIDQLAEDLGNSFQVRRYSFGSEVFEGVSAEYDQKETDLSTLLREIEERHINRNIGAFILVSDGIYNKGANPLYSNHNFNFPLYTIAVGDTAKKKDVILKKAIHNKIAYLGNKFPVEVEMTAYGSKGEEVAVSIYLEGRKLHEKQVQIKTNDFNASIPFLLEAEAAGTRHYQLVISAVNGETNTTNNNKSIFIEVLDGRQHILILGHAPHPDIGALVSSLSAFDNYKVDVQLLADFNKTIDRYDLIILHQLPSSGQAGTVIEQIDKSDRSCLYILGNQTSIPAFNQLMTGMKISGSIGKFNESRAALEKDFSLFTLKPAAIGKIATYPPLLSPFGEYGFSTEHYDLFTQRIGLIESNKPLITFTKRENRKIGIICGEGIWRWRSWSYQKSQSHENFNELIGKMVQFLAVKEDKSRFRISTKNSFYENEDITFDAELYNEAYELINDAEIDLTITDDSAKKYTYVFNRTTNAYTLNAGTLPVGKYSYTATVTSGGEQLVKTGLFTVEPIVIEALNTIANHDLLFQLSRKYNGEMFSINRLDELGNEIRESEEIKPVAYTEEKPFEVIHLKWIFFVLLLFLTVEWFMRKRNGAY